MLDHNQLTAFNDAVLPHLNAAYNLARWLTRNDQDAEDVVQEASFRAFKYWTGFSGRDCRAWLLAIVRNTFYSWQRERSVQPELTADGELDDIDVSVPNPERELLRSADREMLKAALEDLPVEFREVIVLREMGGSVLQGDRRHRERSHRNGNVAPGPRTQKIADFSDERG